MTRPLSSAVSWVIVYRHYKSVAPDCRGAAVRGDDKTLKVKLQSAYLAHSAFAFMPTSIRLLCFIPKKLQASPTHQKK